MQNYASGQPLSALHTRNAAHTGVRTNTLRHTPEMIVCIPPWWDLCMRCGLLCDDAHLLLTAVQLDERQPFNAQ